MMNSEVVWVLVYSETQVQPQKILDPDYIPDYLYVSLGYDGTTKIDWRIDLYKI